MTRTGTLAVCLIAVAALVVSGCGKSKSDSSTKPSTDKTTTTAAKGATTTTTGGKDGSTTTTTEKGLPKSAQTTAASLTVADMGGDWRLYPDKPKEGTGPASNCAKADPKNLGKLAKAQSSGDLLQRGKIGRYVQTTTTEFPDVPAAEAYAQVRLSDEWIECQRALTEGTLAKDPKQTVTVKDLERRNDTGDFRGTYTFLFNTDVKGKQEFTGSYSYHWIYRKSRFLIDVFIQVGYVQTDPKDIDDKLYDELLAGMEKVIGRVPA